MEIAGEIGEKYKMKKLVVIQSNEFLGGAELTPKFQSNLKAGLENINVELHLGERVENLDEISFAECKRQTVKTSKVIEILFQKIGEQKSFVQHHFKQNKT